MPDIDKDSFVYGLDELKEAASWVIESAKQHLIWCFEGEMGSGKTTLIKEICKQLDIESDISSPTFSLVNEYVNGKGEKFFHFDFYRIKSIEEVYDIGFETYFDSGSVCMIEWPEKIEELLEHENKIIFKLNTIDNRRRIRIFPENAKARQI